MRMRYPTNGKRENDLTLILYLFEFIEYADRLANKNFLDVLEIFTPRIPSQQLNVR